MVTILRNAQCSALVRMFLHVLRAQESGQIHQKLNLNQWMLHKHGKRPGVEFKGICQALIKPYYDGH